MCFLCAYIHWVFSYMRIHSLYLRIFRFILFTCAYSDSFSVLTHTQIHSLYLRILRFILYTYAYSDSFSVLTHIPNASSVTAHPMHIRICRTNARKFAECLPCALRSGITYILSDRNTTSALNEHNGFQTLREFSTATLCSERERV